VIVLPAKASLEPVLNKSQNMPIKQ
jgi:hypothetical protein